MWSLGLLGVGWLAEAAAAVELLVALGVAPGGTTGRAMLNSYRQISFDE